MITTIAAFAPILVIKGGIGQIMGALPVVVVAVIIASLIECFLILPGHLAHTLKPTQGEKVVVLAAVYHGPVDWRVRRFSCGTKTKVAGLWN